MKQAQFGSTFYVRFVRSSAPSSTSKETATSVAGTASTPAASSSTTISRSSAPNGPPPSAASVPVVGLWILNTLRSLPTREDLRRTYFWQSRRVAELEAAKMVSAISRTRIRLDI